MTRKTLKRAGEVERPPISILYGMPGIGKSTLASQLPLPLFIQTEDGLTSPLLRDVSTYGLQRSHDDVLTCLGQAYEDIKEFGYKSLVIDSLDGWDPLVERYVCQKHGFPKGVGDVEFGRGWAPLLDEWRNIVTILQSMRDDLSINVMILARHAVQQITPPDAEPYSKYVLPVNKRIAHVLIGEVDNVLFLNTPIRVIGKDVGFGKTASRGVSDKPMIYCQDDARHTAKNRFGMPKEVGRDINELARFIPSFATASAPNGAELHVN